MSVLAGKSGKVNIGSNQVAEISNWNLDFGPDMVETQSFGDSWKERTATLRDWSGSFKGKYDNTDTNGHLALQSAALNGTTVSLKLYEDGTHYYSGTVFVKMAVNADVGGVEEASYTFTGSGALSYT